MQRDPVAITSSHFAGGAPCVQADSSGSLAMLLAMRLASSRVSTFRIKASLGFSLGVDIRKRLPISVNHLKSANRLNGPWCWEMILFAVLLIVIFGISYLRIVFVAFLWPAPYSFHQEQQGPTQDPRQPYRDKSQLKPTAPVGDARACWSSFLQPSTPSFLAQFCLMQSWFRAPAIRLSLSTRLK